MGEQNVYLPGNTFTEYNVTLEDDKMHCVNKKTKEEFEIMYSDFNRAEFGIGNGNLWLKCNLKRGPLVFASPRKCWKSEFGKKLIEKINAVTPIQDMKEYNHYTGPFFFIYMFK